MIVKDEVMPLLVEACPTFQETWNAYVASSSDEPGLLYSELGCLAHHLVALMRAGSTGELSAVFEVVERLHLEGDAYVKEAATIGLLEGIQNVAGHRDMATEAFVPCLRPASATRWAALDDFWAGKSPVVGAGFKRET